MISFGSNNINKVLFGNYEVQSVWFGNTKVYSSAVIYSINASIQHASLSGDTSITAGGTATVTIVPNQGYGFPSTLISVTNAQYSYDNTTGVIILSNATGTVLILGECPVSGMSLAYDWDVDGSVTSDCVNASTTVSVSGEDYVSSSTITITASGGSTYSFLTSGDIEGNPTITANTCTVQLKRDNPDWVASAGSLTISCTSGSQTIALEFNWSGWSCLTGDTLVTLADGSTKRLDQIEVGDYVLSYDWNTMEKMARKVILTDKDAHKTYTEYDVWTFDNGSVVKTVHRHEFYNAEAKRFKYMDEWQLGEHALAIDGTLTALVSHEVVKEEVEHYKITLDTSTNYFANGLLTGDRYCPKNISFEGAI